MTDMLKEFERLIDTKVVSRSTDSTSRPGQNSRRVYRTPIAAGRRAAG